MRNKGLSILLTIFLTVQLIPHAVFADFNDILIMEDFEAETPDTNPSGFDCGEAGGSVKVTTLGENHVANLRNDFDGAYTTLEKTFAETKDVMVTAQLDYMQNDIKVDGNVIMALESPAGELIRIETAERNIAYKTNKGAYIPLKEDYRANRWYHIRVDINLTAKSAVVYIDGVLAAQGLGFLRDSNKINKFTSYTCHSPGYYLEDIAVFTQQVIDKVIITGDTEISIPEMGTSEYIYTATVYDSMMLAVKDPAIEFKLYPADTKGVALQTGAREDQVKVVVSSEAEVSSVALTAAYKEDASITGQLNVNLSKAKLSDLSISGSAKLTYYKKNQNSYQYTASYTDQLGNAMRDENCVWSLEGENVPDCVKIDPQSGLLRVSGTVPKDKKIYVVAVSAKDDQVIAKKAVTMLDWKTYIGDQSRFNAALLFADTVLNKGNDRYNNTPLLADGINVSTELPVEWAYPPTEMTPEPIVMSNLADQGGLMRVLHALSNLTGDEKYYGRVKDIYQYYLDHFVANNGLWYWGGHASIDLKKGTPSLTPNDYNIHELKNHFPYMDPIFELDTEMAEKCCKAIWVSHMQSFQTMLFNRHGSYQTELDFTNTWDAVDNYEDTENGLMKSKDLPFRSSGNDFIYAATELYKYTGDEKALTWAIRLWKKYVNTYDPVTRLGGVQFTTASGAPGTKDPMTELEPIGSWWLADPMPAHYTYTDYGDRAQNQFEDDLVEAGLIDDSQREDIREANVCFAYENQAYCPFVDLELAKSVGLDTEQGRMIVEETVKNLASYAKLAYMPETNKVRPIWANGVDMTGFVIKRTGYFGKAGYVYEPTTPGPLLMLSYTKTYVDSANRDDLQEERAEIWKLIRGMSESFGLGELGIDYPGDRMKLNMDTDFGLATAVMAMVSLYNNTGIEEYIDLARCIADNMITDKFNGQLFVNDPDFENAQFGGHAETFPYALVTLEAAIRGEADAVPTYYPYNGFFSADLLEDNGKIRIKTQSPNTVWKRKLSKTKVTEIIVDNNDIRMNAGEELTLNLTIEPDDASNQKITWSSSNPNVAMISDTNTIYSLSEGVTTLYGISEDLNAKVSVIVTVGGGQ